MKIVKVQCLHSVERERSVVRFYRESCSVREYVPTAWSVSRLGLWFERNMFRHSFRIGVRRIEVTIRPNREN